MYYELNEWIYYRKDIMYLPGVGPHRKEILGKELGIHTYRDLLEYFPYKYVDRTKLYPYFRAFARYAVCANQRKNPQF